MKEIKKGDVFRMFEDAYLATPVSYNGNIEWKAADDAFFNDGTWEVRIAKGTP